MHFFQTKHHLLGGTLLVAGTCIGVGMLALPVATAAGGFLPAISVYILCWLFMVAIGFLIVEACLWCPKDSNLITISKILLGKKGAIFCWIVYLFLLYCLMVAHTAIGGEAIKQIAPSWPNWIAATVYVLLFAPIIFLGTKWVDRTNKIFMVCLVITFLFFIFNAMTHIHFPFLTRMNWSKVWFAIPVIFTAFGFQTLIPTLMTYMDRDARKVKLAIWFGTSIPMVLYLIWELIILGIIPPDLLSEAKVKGENAVTPLQMALENSSIATIGQIFAFLAMTTSFIGLSIAFFDFWADGLKWRKKGFRKVGLCALVFLIPLIIVWIDPTIFLTALNFAGGIGASLLIGVLPVLFVWSGRYMLRRSHENPIVKGGKISLLLLLAFAIFVILMAFFSTIHVD